ncbi:trypsin-1-like [Convolutriloba macropyga]|uniref:trypsin-1-like n=1 Tax=Convolutriloba macropyga TaxID=536237 RepID=UPI003F51B63F
MWTQMNALLILNLCVLLKPTIEDENVQNVSNGKYIAPKRPFYALVRLFEKDTRTIHCSGAVIDQNTVLTTSSCFFNASSSRREIKNLTIGIGDFTKSDYADVIFHSISRIILHPQFDWDSDLNNLAVVKLKRNLPLNQQSIEICLPGFDSGSNIIKINSLPRIKSEVLLETTVKEDPDNCTDIGPSRTGEEICLVDQKPISDNTCRVNLGSPVFVVDKNNNPICLYGIVSYGDFECRNSVAMNVSAYRDWIYEAAAANSSAVASMFISRIILALCALRILAN